MKKVRYFTGDVAEMRSLLLGREGDYDYDYDYFHYMPA